MNVSPARSNQLESAFRLIFHRVSEEEIEERVTNALHLVEVGELERDGIFVATRGEEIVGALVCLPIPGASGLVWPPVTADVAEREAVEDALVATASAHLRRRGARLGQSLLPEEEIAQAAPLLRNGFTHVTTLWYMAHELTTLPPPPPTELTFESASHPGVPDLIADVLRRTYVGSRDCPEVTEVRTTAQVIEGHRSQGKYDPELWLLARHRGEAVGVLLMAEMPEWASLDIAYVGVVPEGRGRGFGRALVHRALAAAEAAGVARLTLSVDGRNVPAWTLYIDLGFAVQERREVILALWGP